MPASERPPERPAGRCFATTQWSVVLRASQEESEVQSEALARLCEAYWYPLYAYVRRRGYAPEDAKDLTQGFFASFLEKRSVSQADQQRGRFRTFLLSSIENFLRGEWDKAVAQKRGGGCPVLPLDEAAAEGRYLQEPVDELTPAKLFEKRWAATLLEGVLRKLRVESGHAARAEFFDLVKPHLWGDEGAVPYTKLSCRLQMSAGALKVAVHRLRQRYRELLRDEIAQTVADASEVNDEIRHLMRVLSE